MPQTRPHDLWMEIVAEVNGDTTESDAAASITVAPTYDPPNRPTLPFAWGRAAAHSTVS